MIVDFDRRDGNNRWPDQVPPGFRDRCSTLGMCRFVEGAWACAGVVEFCRPTAHSTRRPNPAVLARMVVRLRSLGTAGQQPAG